MWICVDIGDTERGKGQGSSDGMDDAWDSEIQFGASGVFGDIQLGAGVSDKAWVVSQIEKIHRQPCRECDREDRCWIVALVGNARKRQFLRCQGWIPRGCMGMKTERVEI